MWLKAVSSYHTLNIGSEILSGKSLYKKIQKEFRDNNLIPTIFCTYVGHHQIYCDILHHGVDNNYLIEIQEM